MTDPEWIDIDYVTVQVYYTIPEMNTSMAILLLFSIITATILIKKRNLS